jgi:hypothetical protein
VDDLLPELVLEGAPEAGFAQISLPSHFAAKASNGGLAIKRPIKGSSIFGCMELSST